MRYAYEIEGVIDAETQEDAEALAAKITGTAKLVHGPMPTFGPIKAVLATCDVAVVTAKKPRSHGASHPDCPRCGRARPEFACECDWTPIQPRW